MRFLAVIVLIFVTSGCGKSYSAIKDDFKTLLYAKSSNWSSAEFHQMDRKYGYDVRATFSTDEKPIYFHAYSFAGSDKIAISANSMPSEKGYAGGKQTGNEIYGLWNYEKSELKHNGPIHKEITLRLARPAEELAMTLHKATH